MQHFDASMSPSSRRLGQIGQNASPHFASTPLLKTTTNRFVVRIGLWQFVPLCAGIEDPQIHCID